LSRIRFVAVVADAGSVAVAVAVVAGAGGV